MPPFLLVMMKFWTRVTEKTDVICPLNELIFFLFLFFFFTVIIFKAITEKKLMLFVDLEDSISENRAPSLIVQPVSRLSAFSLIGLFHWKFVSKFSEKLFHFIRL